MCVDAVVHQRVSTAASSHRSIRARVALVTAMPRASRTFTSSLRSVSSSPAARPSRPTRPQFVEHSLHDLFGCERQHQITVPQLFVVIEGSKGDQGGPDPGHPRLLWFVRLSNMIERREDCLTRMSTSLLSVVDQWNLCEPRPRTSSRASASSSVSTNPWSAASRGSAPSGCGHEHRGS